MIDRLRSMFSRKTIKDDAVAGLVLGVESIPDGLAQGLVAGVNPIFGLHGYLYGMLGAAFATSSVYMTVQATGAMSLVVADVGAVHAGEDAERALFTLALLTGVVMLAAGLLKLGFVLRFVSNSVMVGFMTAVGINIVLGQLEDFTGYASDGTNRLARAVDTLLHPFQMHLGTLLIGIATIVLIIVLERTRLGALGMVVAVLGTSAAVAALSLDVQVLNDITDIPRGLPLPALPLISAIPSLVVPAISLAFVGLVQGAGITGSYANPDGEFPDASRDFVGQGVGNLVSGVFRGMPVGGSASATALITEAGMKTRAAQLIGAGVMALTLIFFSGGIGYIAMPALAALLIVVGFRTIKPSEIDAVWKTGKVQQVVMGVTLVLTIIIPLQYAVLVGVGISMILHIVRSSNNVIVKRIKLVEGELKEVEPPTGIGVDELVVLQPYGSIFFASAGTFEEMLPEPDDGTRNSVVVLRLRGSSDVGSTFTELLGRYADTLHTFDSKLVLMSVEPRVHDQLAVTGAGDSIGAENIYEADDWLGRELLAVMDDAEAWIAANKETS